MLNKFVTGIVAAGISAILAPIALAQGKGEAVKIQDYPGTGNVLFRIALSMGYCESHGIKCQLQVIPSGPLGAQALLAGSIDVAYYSAEVPINAAIKGAKLKIILGGAVQNVYQIAIRNDLDAPNANRGYPFFMADLKGKKIGMTARGSGAEYQFAMLAIRAGLKTDDFTFVAVGAPNTSYGALMSKQIDANMTFEPHGAMCEVLKTCKIIYRGKDATEPVEVVKTNGATAVMGVTQDMIDKTPHIVEALIAAAKDAETFIQDPKNFDEALKIIQTYFKFEMSQGDEVMTNALKSALGGIKTAVSRNALKQIADNMLATKQVDAAVDTNALFYKNAP